MEIDYRWRGALTDSELADLTRSHGGDADPGWWDRAARHSLGWVTARTGADALAGFVNVAWDGGDHAFLLDPKVRSEWQHRGIGTELVARAAHGARTAGCTWLHVDFEDRLAPFYFDACGFRATTAGLLRLRGHG
ncbi:GNAT family N-acetyltransferase [Nocardia sp. NPDC047038]|uniref:GNAT family N-acetyltransferase n=1 Tax=Nocardia sp. NPDC047038 TaxID=3154338 RepID=UPI0033E4E189